MWRFYALWNRERVARVACERIENDMNKNELKAELETFYMTQELVVCEFNECWGKHQTRSIFDFIGHFPGHLHCDISDKIFPSFDDERRKIADKVRQERINYFNF